MNENITSNIGFEKQIWDAACVLCGNIDASEYKSVVLGLIFLKYISDRFEAKYQELLAEGDGFEEDIRTLWRVSFTLLNQNEVNELIAIRNSRALTFYGLNDAFDEELKEWDTFNLEEIPTIAVFKRILSI